MINSVDPNRENPYIFFCKFSSVYHICEFRQDYIQPIKTIKITKKEMLCYNYVEFIFLCCNYSYLSTKSYFLRIM